MLIVGFLSVSLLLSLLSTSENGGDIEERGSDPILGGGQNGVHQPLRLQRACTAGVSPTMSTAILCHCPRVQVGPPRGTACTHIVFVLSLSPLTHAQTVRKHILTPSNAALPPTPLQIRPGDILALSNGYSSLHRKQLAIYVGPKGKLEKIDEFVMMFQEQPNLSASYDSLSKLFAAMT
jgi:hypothetical protein